VVIRISNLYFTCGKCLFPYFINFKLCILLKYIFLGFFFLQDDILCLFQVCLEISPIDTNLVVKCCKLLCKVLPKLSIGEENLLKNTISWTLSSIFHFKARVQYSEQINEILNFYVCTIQAFRNLNINNNKVSNSLHWTI